MEKRKNAAKLLICLMTILAVGITMLMPAQAEAASVPKKPAVALKYLYCDQCMCVH